MHTLRNFIGGRYVTADLPEADLIDPATERPYATAPVSDGSTVDSGVSAAAQAFGGWRDTTPADRQLALLRIADAVQRRSADILDAECANTGKPRAVTEAEELPMMLDQLRFFAGAARHLEGKSAGEYMSGFTSFVRREPVGVCAQVTPWNYPLMMAIWKLAPAIAAGNTVVLKPSDTTPASTLLFAEIAGEFLPPGVLNVVCGDRDTGRLLVEHPVPAMVSITGSVRAGMQVAASAASDVKRVHLELGGKAPVLVFADADIDAAATGIAEAGLFNAGQDCTAATRVLVAAEVHDAFVAALTEKAAATVTGPGPDAFYGPLNNARQFAAVSGFVSRLPGHAVLHCGGKRAASPGYYYAPTVISGLRQDDEAVQNEIFGPVITVQSFESDEGALAMANGVAYGLASSVWTTDHGRAMRMANRLDFGCVWINTHIPLVAEMPHGGFKHSGYGKDLSSYGLEDYTRIKHVMTHLGQ